MQKTRYLLGSALVRAAFSMAFVMSGQVHAQQWRFQQMELLPPYCKYAPIYRSGVPGGNDPAKIKHWEARMGGRNNFMHVHHYCKGLESTNNALLFERDKLMQDRQLRASLNEFDYVLRNVRPDFVLLPEILTKKGENLVRLGRGPEAVQVLMEAIERRGDYWPAYAAMSDFYKSAGDSAKAKHWLEKGLAVAPDAKELHRRMAELRETKK